MLTEPETNYSLLADDEPDPVTVTRPAGRSNYFITCDHGGRRIPQRLGDLGLNETDRQRHIAWDIGVAAVGELMSEQLDACLVTQNYSRLVIDCNRSPITEVSITPVSEETVIPGNIDLSKAEIIARQEEVFWPYHNKITQLLDQRDAQQHSTALVALHSFTPVFKGQSRPWQISLMYDEDVQLVNLLREILITQEDDINVGYNEPYQVSDAVDYTIPAHGLGRGIPHLLIEVRQDLISDAPGQQYWAAKLTTWLRAIAAKIVY